MHLVLADWIIVVAFMGLLFLLANYTRQFSKSSADFLAANRLAGRYLLTMAEALVALGAITVIQNFQVQYKAGFVARWWLNWSFFIIMILSITGFVFYRFRETRSLTLAEFFEKRYNRKFRIFAGILCWITGVVNFGIFPTVGAKFFAQFLGIPPTFELLGITWVTHYLLVVGLVGFALYFTFAGGQITVIITDFMQSMFCNVVFLAILVVLIIKFPVSDWFEGALVCEPGQSRVNPFDSLGIKDYNIWYFLIYFFGMNVYSRMAWQGTQGYNSSARSPHESKMAKVLASFRATAFQDGLLFVPVVAYMIMHHSDYAAQAAQVEEMVAKLGSPELKDQLLVPTTMLLYMPKGLIGAFIAVMLAAFVSTNNSYLHSYGSIFIQDVVMPLKKKRFTNKEHMWALRLSIVVVGIIICIFSCVWKQTEDIAMYFAATGGIWLGGAGSVIIGGLYTKWGKTSGAFAALIGGAIVSVAGVVAERVWYAKTGHNFPINGSYRFAISIGTGISLYCLFSWIEYFAGNRVSFNLDKMLHRGQYIVDADHKDNKAGAVLDKQTILSRLGITPDFKPFDYFIVCWSLTQGVQVIAGWILVAAFGFWIGMGDLAWMYVFKINFLYTNMPLTVVLIIWLSGGAIKDARQLFKDLRVVKRDYSDDGTVKEDYEETT